MNLNKLLKLWVQNNLISNEQQQTIKDFMKERQKVQLFRFLKWISIFAAVWMIIGVVNIVVNFFQLDFMEKILMFILKFFSTIVNFVKSFICEPIYQAFYYIFGDNTGYFFWSILCLVGFWVAFICSQKYSEKTKNDVEVLNLSDEQKYFLKTSYVLDFISCVFLAAVFCLWNMLLIPSGHTRFDDKIFPFFNVFGAITFFIGAYKIKKPLWLFFAIYFVSLSVGMFWGYASACYWIGASRPVIQALVGLILILIGHITWQNLKINNQEDEILEKFGSIYTAFGLFFVFLALWIMSLFGYKVSDSFYEPSSVELWCCNIAFICASLFAMSYGARVEKKIYFNYGLTFLFIETYTVFCSRIMSSIGIGFGALGLGLLLLLTVKTIKKIYLKR
ncbi:MAG: hypothetical protein IJD57_01820 [Candidatus Gastranaerophilales bacterium]|nr:hypothetical protein [Candidatus Gastranaerophilales bacterium]